LKKGLIALLLLLGTTCASWGDTPNALPDAACWCKGDSNCVYGFEDEYDLVKEWGHKPSDEERRYVLGEAALCLALPHQDATPAGAGYPGGFKSPFVYSFMALTIADMMKKAEPPPAALFPLAMSDACSWAQWRYNSDLQTCAEQSSPGLRAECACTFRERYRQELTQGHCPTQP
jgi:hypothetical protein